jgi:hypothetical protein
MSGINQQTDIRDIKDFIPLPSHPWWLYVGIGVGALAVIALALWYVRSRRKPKNLEHSLLPHEAALAELATLLKAGYLEQGRSKEFCFTLSGIVRLYVERQFVFPASDRTLEEIKRDIRSIAGLDDTLRQDLLHILSESDLVKFADKAIPQEHGFELVHLAQRFVTATIPPQANAQETSL